MTSDEMNFAQAIHIAARRYCQDRFAFWSKKYSDVDRRSDEAQNIFPRYNILSAIRVDLERLDPNDLLDLEFVRNTILHIGMQANDEFGRRAGSAIAANAIAAERKSFCSYVSFLSEPQLRSVLPLPYRRVLSGSESEMIWTKVRERWHIHDHYWHPLSSCDLTEIAAFQDHYFREFCITFKVAQLLSAHDIGRIWELREFGSNYELDVSEFDPIYNGAEGYWVSDKLDWIVYASHESSITVGGWLLQVVKENWSDSDRRIWESPYFD